MHEPSRKRVLRLLHHRQEKLANGAAGLMLPCGVDRFGGRVVMCPWTGLLFRAEVYAPNLCCQVRTLMLMAAIGDRMVRAGRSQPTLNAAHAAAFEMAKQTCLAAPSN
jgi:hypothetical protein